MPLIFDSGIASGTDILRAFALGADFTFVGRAPHYGLAAFGRRGVNHVLDILRASLEADMGQMGLARPAEAAARRAA
jgi:L-lactate dehydrogenase (cytochrome)